LLQPHDVGFHALNERFQRLDETPHLDMLLDACGYRVRLRVIGERWAELVKRSLGRLAITNVGEPSDLCIDLWDASATQAALPQLNGDIVLKGSTDGRYVGDDRAHSRQWLDLQESRIVGAIESTAHLQIDELSRPCQKLLSAWLMERGVQFIHSGMVAHNGRGALFVGRGGSGKSTCSVACLAGGLDYLGDDFIGLATDAGAPMAEGMFASALLGRDHIQRFPELNGLDTPTGNAADVKTALFLDALSDSRFMQRSPISAIVLPRVVGTGRTFFEPATKGKALLALAPSSVMYLPRPEKNALEPLSDLVSAVPCFWLNLGADVHEIPLRVKEMLESLDVQSEQDRRENPQCSSGDVL